MISSILSALSLTNHHEVKSGLLESFPTGFSPLEGNNRKMAPVDGQHAKEKEAILQVTAAADSRRLFCEMLELRPGQTAWRETARWVKFEENVEEDGNRWSKPFVASLSLHALMELRNCVGSGSLLLDLEARSLIEIFHRLVENWIHMAHVSTNYKDALLAVLMQPYKHQHQQKLHTARSFAQDLDELGPQRQPKPGLSTQHSTAESLDALGIGDEELGRAEKPNKKFLRKIPPGTGAAVIMLAELEFITRPLYGFIRLKEPVTLRNFTEVSIPTQYVYVMLMPKNKGGRVHEIGRTMGTLFSDEFFQQNVYDAKDRNDLLVAIDDFMGSSTVLPPGGWNPSIRIEPPTQVQSKEARQKDKMIREGSMEFTLEEEHESHGTDIRRTGRFCGGLVDDIKRKAKFYLADIKEALHVQSVASIIFLYFASMTPLVTFGGLMSTLLKGRMGAMETILARALSGVFWGITAGQPLVILGSTGPILVFDVIIFNLCEQMGLEYLSLRVWIGIWSAVILLVMVITDASFLVSYITRFTEESFAALVSAIFMYEAVKKLLDIANKKPINIQPAIVKNYTCNCNLNDLLLPIDDDFNKTTCKTLNGTLTGYGCDFKGYVPDAFLLSVCLFFGTFILARILKAFKFSPYGPARVRQIVSDFAVIISIATFVGIDIYLGIPTPKLIVPDDVKPTYEHRDSWIIPFFGPNPWWTCIAAVVPGLLATILIFMDQQITTVIVSRKENKLRHGLGYHLDLLIVAILVGLLSVIGMPWMIADTVLSLTHSSSLRMESEVAAPGERPTFLGIREQRVTNIIISILVGVSIFLTQFLQMIPMPVLFGVFLFMGSNAFLGLQFTDRLRLVFMPLKYQPDFVYLRHVRISRVHLYTLFQLISLATLWVLKSFQETAMLFPLMVGALVGVRKLLDKVFTRKELSYLDDLMPEDTKRKKEDDTTTEDEEYFKVDRSGLVRIPLPNGNVLTVPVGLEAPPEYQTKPAFSSAVQETQLWKSISSGNIVDDGKNGQVAPNIRTDGNPKSEESKHLLP